MKRSISFQTARVAASILLLMSSVTLLVALIPDMFHFNQIVRGPTLLGPSRSSEFSQQSQKGKQSSQLAPAPNAVAPAPPSGEYVGFEIFEAPGTLVNVTSTSQGPAA